MKKLLTTILSITLLTTPVQAALAAETTTYLNVRNMPTTIGSTIIDVLPPHTYVDCYDSGKTDWNKIYINGVEGYVYNTYLTGEQETVRTECSQIHEEGTGRKISGTSEKRQLGEIERLYEPSEFQWLGVLNYDGWRWTWYTERVLPGPGLNIPDRHTNEDGYVCDEDEYICLASVDLNQGTIVKTPLGYYGKVYDTGCPQGTLDVYTNW